MIISYFSGAFEKKNAFAITLSCTLGEVHKTTLLTKFEEISSLTNNISPPPFEFRSNLYGVLNPSIKKFPMGKLSSIFFF